MVMFKLALVVGVFAASPLVFREIWRSDHGPITVQMDNQAAIQTAKNGKLSARNRHFLIRQSVLKEALAGGVIFIEYTPSEKVIADGLTKSLQRVKHEAFLALLQLNQS